MQFFFSKKLYRYLGEYIFISPSRSKQIDQAKPVNNTQFSPENEVKKIGVAGLRKREGPSGNWRERGIENGNRKVVGAGSSLKQAI